MTQDRVNNFAIKIATVNGTGSASANSLLMKSIFRSGVPVMGKNYFPSNIQGLPTWYEIRVTKDSYVARSGKVDLMVAMNAETYTKDVREVASGGYLIYDSTWPRPALLARDDITVLGVPLAKMCNENFNGVRTRILMKNICLCRRACGAARSRRGEDPRPAGRDLRQEARARGLEHEGHRARL
jgi:2-oxoglutarate ferredoxin oxidoreductase subunit alpha